MKPIFRVLQELLDRFRAFAGLLTICIVLLVSLSFVCVGSAANINVDFTSNTKFFNTMGGSVLPDQSLVRVGFINSTGTPGGSDDFNLPGNQAILMGGVYSAVDAIFVPLAEGVANSGMTSGFTQSGATGFPNAALRVNNNILAPPNPGGMAGEIVSWTVGYMPVGYQLVVLVSNATSLGATPTEFGVFADPNWLSVDPNPAVVGDANVSGFNVDAASDALYGTFDGTNVFLDVNVPEPSQALLLMLGMTIFFGRRTRSLP